MRGRLCLEAWRGTGIHENSTTDGVKTVEAFLEVLEEDAALFRSAKTVELAAGDVQLAADGGHGSECRRPWRGPQGIKVGKKSFVISTSTWSHTPKQHVGQNSTSTTAPMGARPKLHTTS